MKIKKGDTVLIISGKNRGKRGKVLQVFPREGRVVVEGVNLRKKHIRPRRAGEKGQIVEMPAPLHVSNIKIICSKCRKATRIGYKIVDKTTTRPPHPPTKGGPLKFRICKKCGQEI